MKKRKQVKTKKLKMFNYGALIGLTCLSIALASAPKHGTVTDDTALYQSLSEIRVPKQAKINFDEDIALLSRIEPRYQEKLPTLAKQPGLQGPMQRISQQKYQYGSTVPVKKKPATQTVRQ